MKPTKKTVLIIAGVCLLALALLSAGFAAYTTFRMNFAGGAGPMGALPSNGSGNGQLTPPQGDFTPGEGQTPPEGNFNRDDFNGQRPDSSGFPGGVPGRRGFGVSRWLSLGAYVLTLLGAIAAAVGIFKARKWGVILGIIIAALLLISGVLGLFGAFGGLNLIIPIGKILLAAGVIILLLLPAARRIYAAPKAQEDDNEDDDDEDEAEGTGAAGQDGQASGEAVQPEAGEKREVNEAALYEEPSAAVPTEETPVE
ncbi:MAG: DUF308 domain-containing protein [Anaerolineaceae bacterium]|jgi:hypothetical protein